MFVTAYDEHAADAYDLGAVDYLRKPVEPDRMSTALRKVVRLLSSVESARSSPPDALAALPAEAQGGTRFVRRRDTVKLHTHSGVHIVRRSLSGIAEHWLDAGFIHTHRSYLVAVSAITELRSDSIGGLVAHTELGDVPISRRYARLVRERLFRAAQTDKPKVVDDLSLRESRLTMLDRQKHEQQEFSQRIEAESGAVGEALNEQRYVIGHSVALAKFEVKLEVLDAAIQSRSENLEKAVDKLEEKAVSKLDVVAIVIVILASLGGLVGAIAGLIKWLIP